VHCFTTRTSRVPVNCSRTFHVRQICKSGVCIPEFWRLSPYPSVGIDVMRELSVHFLRNNGQSILLRVIDREYFPISRPTDATCVRFLFSVYMCITLHVSSVKRSSSGVPHCTYSLYFLCLCLSAALSCNAVPQTDTNTESRGCMYSEGLLMMSA
jgi:hypothetical protein